MVAFIIVQLAEIYRFLLTIYRLSHFVDGRISLDRFAALLDDLTNYFRLGHGRFIVVTVSNILLIACVLLVVPCWERDVQAEGASTANRPIYSMAQWLNIVTEFARRTSDLDRHLK